MLLVEHPGKMRATSPADGSEGFRPAGTDHLDGDGGIPLIPLQTGDPLAACRTAFKNRRIRSSSGLAMVISTPYGIPVKYRTYVRLNRASPGAHQSGGSPSSPMDLRGRVIVSAVDRAAVATGSIRLQVGRGRLDRLAVAPNRSIWQGG
jgi:hypothetical protein